MLNNSIRVAQKKIIIIGSAHPLRGGLASFNQRLTQELIEENINASIYTFSLQYPNFIFPGTTQYSSEPAPKGFAIKVCINAINPFNWIKVGLALKKENADIVVVRYWLPFMAPCLGTILRFVTKNKKTKIVCIADNIVPHEKRLGDTLLTKYFVSTIHFFIVMSKKVQTDLSQLFNRKAILVEHPLYDNFGTAIEKKIAQKYLDIQPSSEKTILFFGFIRKYKGLDLLLHAMADERIKKANIRLLIAGEFYDNKDGYLNLIEQLNLKDQIILRTNFIPDSEVKYYLSACDFVIQPYKNATQSGVTPLAYHFEKPMLVTNVGGLPHIVPHKKVGIVCEPDSPSIVQGILDLYELGDQFFIPHLKAEKQKYSWHNLTQAILENT